MPPRGPVFQRSTLLSLTAVLSAASAGLVCEISFNAAREAAPPLAYAALCALLTFGPALLVALLAAPLRSTAVALAVWVGLCAAVVSGLLPALGFAGVALVALWGETPSRSTAIRSGTAVALALCLAVIAWPRLGSAAGLLPESPLGRDLSAIAVMAAVLLGRAVAIRLFPRVGARLEPIVALSIFALAFVAVPLLSWPGSGERELPDCESASLDASLPHIILIVLDTVRADHLSVYGYERDTTPAMRGFLSQSDRAVLYPHAFSPSPWTAPAHASLFTGRIPSDHGAHTGSGLGAFTRASLTADQTLAEVLESQGYCTAGISANLQLFRVSGLERGFDVFYRPPFPRPLHLLGEGLRARFLPWVMAHTIKPYPAAEVVNREVLRFVDHCLPGPCFVLANYKEAHFPYVPRPPHAGVFSDERDRREIPVAGRHQSAEENHLAEARYDEEIRSLDERIGELLAALEERGILDRAWLVITSDHGEAFGEHELFGHQTGIHNDQVRIPLLLQPPRGQSLTVRSDAVDLLDVTATLSAVAGPGSLGEGRDLRDPSAGGRPIQIELFGLPSEDGPVPVSLSPARGVVLGLDKLIERRGRRELYHLGDDPAERDDRAGEQRETASALAEHLPPLRRGERRDGERLSIDEEEQLRALGYAH